MTLRLDLSNPDHREILRKHGKLDMAMSGEIKSRVTHRKNPESPPKLDEWTLRTTLSPEVESISLILPFPVSVNDLYGTNKGGKGRHLTERGSVFKDAVAKQCIKENVGWIDGLIRLSLWWYRPNKEYDTDNRIKSIQDSLEGICYKNDRQVDELHVYRRVDSYVRAEVLLEKINTI